MLAWLAREKQNILTPQPCLTYSHANTPLGQSERAYYFSYFIINHRLALRKRNIFPSGFRSTIGIYGFHELNPRPFLNTSIRPGIIRSGTKLSLLTETLTAWYPRIWSLSTWDFTLTTSTGTYSGIEIPEAWMSTIRQHDNWPLYHAETPRDQPLPLTMPTMLWIETHQPWARFVIHQSLTTTVVPIVRLSKSTIYPDEDLQCAVEMSRSTSKWQSWDKR